MSCLQNIVEKHFAPKTVEHFNNTAFVDYLYQLSCFLKEKSEKDVRAVYTRENKPQLT